MTTTLLAEDTASPYPSPPAEPSSTPAPPAPFSQPGSLAVIMLGSVLLLVGYLASNVVLINDLYRLWPEIHSPLLTAGSTPVQLWLVYVACAAACVCGAVMVGSQRFHPLASVCYIMCPLAALVWMMGWPLRAARTHAGPVAAIYLVLGSCLAGMGAMELLLLYGHPTDGFAPVKASLMTQVGLTLTLGAQLKIWRTPRS